MNVRTVISTFYDQNIAVVDGSSINIIGGWRLLRGVCSSLARGGSDFTFFHEEGGVGGEGGRDGKIFSVCMVCVFFARTLVFFLLQFLCSLLFFFCVFEAATTAPPTHTCMYIYVCVYSMVLLICIIVCVQIHTPVSAAAAASAV